MSDRKLNFSFISVNFLLFATALLIQYNDSFSVKIYSANPMLPLAVLVSFSMFSSEMSASFAGLLLGIFADSVSGMPIGFNTVLFFLIGLAVSLMVRYLFNNNYRCALMLCLLCAVTYFIARWLIGFAFGGLQTSLGYLMRFAAPSIAYTCVFAIPLYYLQKFLLK